jgi:hypothetical protein
LVVGTNEVELTNELCALIEDVSFVQETNKMKNKKE